MYLLLLGAAWRGDAESDWFSPLVLRAGLPWREVAVLRAYARYARQVGVAYGMVYIADVLLADGTNVSHVLVEEGRCWWSRKSAPDNAELERLELEAREAKKGLWEDPEPIPPWEFRKAHRRRSP